MTAFSRPAIFSNLRNVFVAVLLMSLFGGVSKAAFPNDFEVYFPQVARGTQGVYIETVLTIINPHPQVLEVILESSGVDLPEGTIELQPLERRQIRFAGDPLQVGWVRLVSQRVVSASARILTRPSAESDEILGNISILGQAPTSKVVIPVLLNTKDVDNTGIALAYIKSGLLRATLFDSAGTEIASVEGEGFTSSTPGEHAAIFVDQLFPNLPEGLSEAVLLIEHVLPNRIAVSFAATALYTHGNLLVAAEVTSIDDPREYIVLPKNSEESIETVAEALATTYGFEIDRIVGGGIGAVMTHEQARAVARDPRVSEVLPNNPGPVD